MDWYSSLRLDSSPSEFEFEFDWEAEVEEEGGRRERTRETVLRKVGSAEAGVTTTVGLTCSMTTYRIEKEALLIRRTRGEERKFGTGEPSETRSQPAEST